MEIDPPGDCASLFNRGESVTSGGGAVNRAGILTVQIPRPCVAATTSSSTALNCQMDTAGRISLAYYQPAPSFVETNRPISVPTQISLGLWGITRRQYVATSGNPFVLAVPDPKPEMSCQV